MVLRSVHVSRARPLHYDIDGAAVVTMGARLHTRTNHLQVGRYARKHRSAGARFHIREHDVVERVAFHFSETQQGVMGLLPAIHQLTLLFFSVVSSRHKSGSKIA